MATRPAGSLWTAPVLAYIYVSTMSDLSAELDEALAQSSQVMSSLARLGEPLTRAAHTIVQCLSSNHKLLVCGNGGSAADAAHFATEFVVRFSGDRRAYPALAWLRMAVCLPRQPMIMALMKFSRGKSPLSLKAEMS